MTLSTLIFTELTIESQNFHPKSVENMKRRVINLVKSSRKSMIVTGVIFKELALAGQIL